MPHPFWRDALRRLASRPGASPRPRGRVTLGRDTRLEDRLAPATLRPAARKIQDDAPSLAAPPMPGLAAVDPALAGAIQSAWQVPAGTTTERWVFAVAEGQDPHAVAG